MITRQLTAMERSRIDETLSELCQHFHEWTGYHDNEHDLIGFAIYEGCGGTKCCGEIMVRAAPLALGKRLVQKHKFEWQMIQFGDDWHYGVSHIDLPEPIDLLLLENGSHNPENYDEEPSPGQVTHESYEFIVNDLQRSQRK